MEIEREIVVPEAPGEVWEALTDAERGRALQHRVEG